MALCQPHQGLRLTQGRYIIIPSGMEPVSYLFSLRNNPVQWSRHRDFPG